MSAKTKWTDADVLDQAGRVAIVTGSNSGLGFDTARIRAAWSGSEELTGVTYRV